ncbi:Lsr2 family protein [Rhodococcus fascians]|nr:Lsr2 family protein [Rhodococcus fascians]MBY4024520.1 Lsr2 family protein [Rhodococcus fascians]
MAKFTTRSIYTFTDELTGEEVEQDNEPTTFKIKLTGDTTVYEKVMSTENEERFRKWLASDGDALAEELQDQIDALKQEVNDLSKENADLSNRAGKGRAANSAKRDPEQLRAMREWLNSNGYKVSGRGRIPRELEEAYNSRTPKVPDDASELTSSSS